MLHLISVTSICKGILIGYVSEVTVDSNNLTRSGYITPAVDFKNLQGGTDYYIHQSRSDRRRKKIGGIRNEDVEV